MISLLALAVVVTFWLLPTIVAAAREMPNIGAVIVVDVLLGWTIIGWIVALAMACGARPQPLPYWPSAHQLGPDGRCVAPGHWHT